MTISMANWMISPTTTSKTTRISAPCRLTVVRWPPLEIPTRLISVVICRDPNVIGMPGISNAAAEVNVMEPRSFDEMPRAIQALRERKTVILNLTMMEPDQAQRAVDFVAGGTFAIDGHQERVGESIFLFAPSCVTVTNTGHDEASAPTVVSREADVADVDESASAPSPAWGAAAL